MGAAAELFVKVSADLKGLTAGFDQAGQAAKKLGDDVGAAAGNWVDANGRMRDASGKFVAGAKAAGSAATSLSDLIKGVAAGELLADGIRSAASAMVGMGQQSIKLAGELEQNKVAFTTMLGSAAKADAMLRELASFAASTPFELRGLTDSTKKLLAFGFDAKAVIPIMNSVGNAVAAVGGGKDVLDGVTMALGQMAAKGKVSAEEMNQLAERGIPAWKMLADGIGVSVPEAMKKAEKGSIDAGTAITALVNGMNQKFPGMMQKQSQTIMGALSNLQDSADAALTKIGQKLIETFNLTRVVQAMSTAISNLTAAFTSGGLIGALDKAFGPTTKAAVLGISVAVTSALIPSLTAATSRLLTMAAAAAPFVALAGAIAFAAYPIAKNWDGIKGTITALWDTAAQYTAAYYNRAVRIASDLANNFTTAFRYIGDAIRGILGDELTNKLLGGLSRATGAFRGFAETAVTPLKAVGSVASVAASNFADTWRDAMSMSKGFTSGLFTAAAVQTRDFGKTLTADMLGLAKASATAAGAATKAGAAVKAKAVEMRKAATEARALEAQYMRNLKTYLAQEDATYRLRDALRVVDADQQRLGLAFDVSGAKAAAYRSVLSELESAFGKTSAQARGTKTAIAELEAASKNGGAASAAAYKTIAEGADELEKARAKAAALGHEFKATDEAIKTTEATIGKLIDQGLKPGAKAYDEQIAKLAELRKTQEQQPRSLDDMVRAQQGLIESLRDVGSGIGSIIEALGVQVPEVVKVGAAALVAGAIAVGAFTLAVGSLTTAWGTFTAAFAANPIGLALLGVGAAIVGIVAAVAAVQDHQRKVAEEAAATLAKTEEEAARVREALGSSVGAGLKDAAKAFIAGADDYREKMRMALREGIINGVLDALVSKAMLDQLGGLMQDVIKATVDPMQAGLADAMAALTKGAEATLKKLEPVLAGLRTQLDVYAPMAVKEADESAKRIARAASGGGTGGGGGGSMEARNREALASYQNNLLRVVENLANRGAQSPSSPLHNQYLIALDEANKASRDLRGMATGGLVTGPTLARMGEGGRNEAVLPLNENVYRQIGEGIVAARGGGSGMQLVVNYSGSGKWTREDAQGLGRLLVSELRAMGVRA